MSSYYLNKFKPLFDIEEKTRCLMYQISSTSPPRSWYIRVRRKDGSYFNQSTELTNRTRALRRAQEIYLELRQAETKGVVYGRNTFKRVWKEFYKNHTCGEDRKRTMNSRYTRYLTYFDSYELHNINQTTFKEYLVWRVNYWDEHQITDSERNIGKYGRGGVYNTTKFPSAISLQSERQLLIQLLRYAHSRQWIDNVPLINSDMFVYEKNDARLSKKINHKKSRGSPIPEKTLARIMGKMRYWAIDGNTETHPEHRYARQRLYYFILITSNSLLRQGTEATRMKYIDIGSVRSKTDKDVKLYFFNVRHGKKQRYGADDTVKFLTPDGLVHLLKWRKICQEEYGLAIEDDEYIFPKLNGDEVDCHYMTRLFRRQLLKWDKEGEETAKKARKHKKYTPMAVDKEGRNITLYSFRHSRISKLLVTSGRSIAEVSRMADVSLVTMSKSYFKTQMLADADRYADMSPNRNAVERISDEEKEWVEKTLKDLGM